ncbi:MAG: prepilin-type N-terminal cleavage/methylation domain-containing protein [Candidatus Omnitrophica bacterium]|nr:prepilin-type N-terminal cleavage/methylation domain-containing protein [Candidatus Omnitrophota bacterium]
MLSGIGGRSKRDKGFTLIEVLIVVVIIGVLAALIIPRFVAAPDKAIVAEANMTLGALGRAQQKLLDSVDPPVVGSPLAAEDWAELNMQVPVNPKFQYGCTATDCTATRIGEPANTATYDFTTYTWSCTGDYAPVTSGGCGT